MKQPVPLLAGIAVMSSEPNDNTHGEIVVLPHECDLGTTLRQIILVDADSIDPYFLKGFWHVGVVGDVVWQDERLLEEVEKITADRKPAPIENNGRCCWTFSMVGCDVRKLPSIRQSFVSKTIISSEICDVELAFKLPRLSRIGDDFKQPDGLGAGKGFILVLGQKAVCIRDGHLLRIDD